jgi:FKBP-type peptidyl-prolyl cis-trans isomerase SlyD
MSPNASAGGETFEFGEFVEIEYTARIAEEGTVIDTTDPSVSAEAGLADIDANDSSVVILGAGHVFEPVEDAIAAMRPDERRTVVVEPADAFGVQDPTQRRSIPVGMLSEESIEQNDRVTLDGRVGFVDAVDDGTATVDFNHPLAGTPLEYELRAVDRVTGVSDRTVGLLALYGLEDDVAHAVADGVLECSVERSAVPDGAWYDRKRQFLEAATEHLDVDAVRFEERYATT